MTTAEEEEGKVIESINQRLVSERLRAARWVACRERAVAVKELVHLGLSLLALTAVSLLIFWLSILVVAPWNRAAEKKAAENAAEWKAVEHSADYRAAKHDVDEAWQLRLDAEKVWKDALSEQRAAAERVRPLPAAAAP